jgi:hypothetical protein
MIISTSFFQLFCLFGVLDLSTINGFTSSYPMQVRGVLQVPQKRLISQTRLFNTHQPLNELLEELSKRGTSFSPAASRAELEALLKGSADPDIKNPKRRSRPSREDLERTKIRNEGKDIYQQQPREQANGDDYYAPRSSSRSINKKNINKRSTTSRRNRRQQQDSSSSSWRDDDFEKDCDDDDDDDAQPKGQERRTRVGRQRHQPSATDQLLRVVSKASRVVGQVLPGRVVEIGSRAQRVAKRKTKQVWNELVELTYDDDDEDRSSTRRRPTRETVANDGDDEWREPPRPEPRKERPIPSRRGSERTDMRSTIRYDTNDDDDNEPMKVKNDDTGNNPSSSTIDTRSPSTLEEPPIQTSKPEESKRVPLQILLEELDALDTHYPADASRQQLEDLLAKAKSREMRNNQQDMRKTMENQDNNSSDRGASWKGIWAKTSKVASSRARSIPKNVSDARAKASSKIRDTAQDAVQTAKSKASNLFQTDEDEIKEADGILDAVIEDYSRDRNLQDRDDLIEVEPIDPEEWEARGRGRSSAYKSSQARSQANSTKQRRKRPRPARAPAYTTSNRSYRSAFSPDLRAASEQLPRLPPSFDGENSFSPVGKKRTRQRRTRNSFDEERKIYSPYSLTNSEIM